MNDDHDMTRHLPNAEAMPADFEQTEALPTLVGGASEQASAITQALPVELTQTLPVAETEAMPVEKVAVPQAETKSLPVDSASTEKLSAEPLAAGAVSDESAAPVDDGQTETEPAADAFGNPAAASDRRTGDVPAGATTAGDVPDKGQPLAVAPSTVFNLELAVRVVKMMIVNPFFFRTSMALCTPSIGSPKMSLPLNPSYCAMTPSKSTHIVFFSI